MYGCWRNSKRKVILIWKSTHIGRKNILYRIMKPLLIIFVTNLNYTSKLPDWSIFCCHGNRWKNRLHDSMWNIDMYLRSKYEHNSTYGYWVRMTPVFSQSEALYGYHGNEMKIKHWFCRSVTRATIWYIKSTLIVLLNWCFHSSSETELRLFSPSILWLAPLITVEDRQNLSSEKLAWLAVSSPTAEISVYQWLPLLQAFLQ